MRKTDQKVLDRGVAAWRGGLSREDAARSVGISRPTLGRELARRGLSRGRDQWGPKHPRWNGGRRKTPAGYIEVWVDPTDALAVETAQGRRTVKEHRLIMARELGRPLRPNEYVHHKNGVRDDNRPENLQLASVHRPGQHPVCSSCGSHDIRYEDHHARRRR